MHQDKNDDTGVVEHQYSPWYHHIILQKVKAEQRSQNAENICLPFVSILEKNSTFITYLSDQSQ